MNSTRLFVVVNNKKVDFWAKDATVERRGGGRNVLKINPCGINRDQKEFYVPVNDILTSVSYDPHDTQQLHRQREYRITEDMLRDIEKYKVSTCDDGIPVIYRLDVVGVLEVYSIDFKEQEYDIILDSDKSQVTLKMDNALLCIRQYIKHDDPIFLEWMKQDILSSKDVHTCVNKATRLIGEFIERVGQSNTSSPADALRGKYMH